MIDLIAIDMDGTLLDAAHTISPRVKQAVTAARARGIRIVLATGRPFSGVEEYLEELGIAGDDDYCITFNGAVIQNASGTRTVAEASLGYDDFLYCEKVARDLGVHFHMLYERSMMTPNADISSHTVRDAYISRTPLLYRSVEQVNPAWRFRKFMMVDDEAVLDRAIANLPSELMQRYTVVKSAADFLEILHPDAGKGRALKTLAAHLGVPSERIMAIGDQENDLVMLQFAGVSVAMGNAIDAVKAIADHVTTSNNEDGVAVAIERYVLKRPAGFTPAL
ncbi:MAG TPA: sugar-phosphatase [Luteibacter sp.]|uniref:sugar-phosphatase n=1 Tax=Luteibacter sp. TaxID=1886636 RepID=UPI002BB1786D|nr:sugar-phosphatase [Luteibacter sp.]HVI56251.1 sugar-phosphatase [Luteibacter sp.]